MKRTLLLALTGITLLVSGPAMAQVAGEIPVGVAVQEMKEVALGWSAKKQVLGNTVYNDKNEKVGKVDDIIIAPDKTVSYLIVGAGGFVGLGRHEVAIPAKQVKEESGKMILPGATKDVVKALPPFQYASNQK